MPSRAEDRAIVDRFIAAFNRIDRHVRAVIDAGRDPSFADVARRYCTRVGSRNERALVELADIRNLLAHRVTTPGVYPVVPTEQLVVRAEAIATEMEAAPRAIPTFRRKVVRVHSEDSLSSVLRLIEEHNFTQYPVYRQDEFVGLLTENGITRWLSRHVTRELTLVDLEEVPVRTALREEESSKVAAFMAGDRRVGEVVRQFRESPLLEAVLFTTGGKRSETLLGIATRWDLTAHLG